MAEDTIESLRAERDAARAELNSVQGELTGAKQRIGELNSENGGHRSNYSREKRAREELQAQLDAVTTERDGLKTTHDAEIERQRIDLTAKSADVERRANETIETYKAKRADMSLAAVATRLGMVDLDGLKLLDRSTFKVTDDGEVENAEDVLTAFKEQKSYFFGITPKPGTVTGTTAPIRNPPRQASPQAFDAMSASREDYETRKREMLATAGR